MLKQLLKNKKQAKKALSKRRYAPRQPDSIRLQYVQFMRRVVLARLKELTKEKLLPKLKKIAGRVASETNIIEDSSLEDLSEIIDDMWDTVSKQFGTVKFRDLVFDIGRAAASFQAKEMNKYFAPVVGVDVVGGEDWLRPEISKFTAENVALIKSVPSQYFTQLETTLAKGISDGLRPEALAKIVEERFGVAESKALLIARDQVGKFYGDLERIRQADLGVTKYTWQTANDSRVRDEHAARQGESFEWNDPPVDGHPGEAINCRCYAEPDLSDILGE